MEMNRGGAFTAHVDRTIAAITVALGIAIVLAAVSGLARLGELGPGGINAPSLDHDLKVVRLIAT
ncbi:MAG: hypothetical protein IPM60_10480 [Rhodospirillales bacterium]|nr:hypothetical protein [Rhodospirillales bacterium]